MVIMTTNNQDQQDIKELKKLFESAVLPSLIQMIEAVGEQSYQSEQRGQRIEERLLGVEKAQPDTKQVTKDSIELVNQLQNLATEGSANEEGFQILTHTISVLGERFGDLIKTNNELIRSQRQQIERMEHVIHSFEENTARLDTLTLAMQSHIESQAYASQYAQNEPVFSEIEDQVRQIRGSKKEPSINDTKVLGQSTPIKEIIPSVQTQLMEQINALESKQEE